MFKKVSAVVLFVEDFATCLKFYEDTLGLEVGLREPDCAAFKMEDQDFVLQGMTASAKMVNVALDEFEAQTGGVDRVLLCARVDDVDAIYTMLKGKGVEFTQAPIDQPWGIRTAYFRDPEGNIWEIAQALAS